MAQEIPPPWASEKRLVAELIPQVGGRPMLFELAWKDEFGFWQMRMGGHVLNLDHTALERIAAALTRVLRNSI